MDFLESFWPGYVWVLGLSMIVISSVIGRVHRHWQRRREFYRRGDGGLQEFKSYAHSIRVSAFEVGVGCLGFFITYPLFLCGLFLLILGLVVLASDGAFTFEAFQAMVDEAVEAVAEFWAKFWDGLLEFFGEAQDELKREFQDEAERRRS